MNLNEFSGRLGRIEEKLESLSRLTACLESIAEKIRYMDQVSKQRIGTLEQDIKVLQNDMVLMKQKCAVQISKCPVEKVSRFEWLIFGTCITTMGALAVALIVAYMQIRQVMPV